MARKSKSRKCKRSQKRVKSYIKRSGKKVRSFCRRKSNRRSRSIKRRGPSRKKCPPNKKAIRSYRKKSGKRVKSYCRNPYPNKGYYVSSYQAPVVMKPIINQMPTTKIEEIKEVSIIDLPKLVDVYQKLENKNQGSTFSSSGPKRLEDKRQPKPTFSSTGQKRLEDKKQEQFIVNSNNCLRVYGLQEGKYNPNDVNKNFRKLALRWHPDKIKGDDSPYYFRDVVEPCKLQLLK